MKVIRWLALLLFVSGCGGDGARNEGQVQPPPVEPGPQATTGDEGPPASRPITASVARKPALEPVERRDARAAATGEVTRAARQQGVNTDAAILADFNARVAKYMNIHDEAAKGGAKLKETDEPAEIDAAQQALAGRIRAARADASQGDIFTAEIRHTFRRLLAPELKGEDGRDAKTVLKDDAPAPGSIPFKVNAKYPEGAPLPTVPAKLLLNLPTLPEPLEYRIIGRHLVLLDTSADLLVDYVPNAIR